MNRIIDIPIVYANDGDIVEGGTVIADWDPFNSVIVTEFAGRVRFEGVKEGLTYRVDVDAKLAYLRSSVHSADSSCGNQIQPGIFSAR